jgi:hypothetical protein
MIHSKLIKSYFALVPNIKKVPNPTNERLLNILTKNSQKLPFILFRIK